MSAPVSERRKKLAARWNKISDFFFGVAQLMAPVAQIPIVNLVANPIMNGFWGFWYISSAIAHKYDPTVKHNEAHSALNIASYIIGGIVTIVGFAALVPPLWPIAIPILLPIAAIATAASTVLWAVALGFDLHKERKHGRPEGQRWRIGQRATALLYGVGSVVIAGLIIAALFTPVGWAAGAGALTFAIAASAATIGVFAVSKFCQWRAHVAETRQALLPVVPNPIYSMEKKAAVEMTPPSKTTEPEKSLVNHHKDLLTEFEQDRKKHEPVIGELAKRMKKDKKEDEDDGEGESPLHP